MNITKRCATLAGALLLSLSACSSTPDPIWEESAAPTVSRRVLWEVTRIAFEREGFPQVAPGFDPVNNTVTSGWRTELAPFSGQGFRERAWVKYSTTDTGKLSIEVRVQREVNKNLARPLDPQYADWEEARDSRERARFLLQVIKGSLVSGGARRER
ncbi:MAG: hypothetical protein MK291_03720 [Planctomycetes bacterium]|nr:hypothetical protein [Planctomycetota bacterium]